MNIISYKNKQIKHYKNFINITGMEVACDIGQKREDTMLKRNLYNKKGICSMFKKNYSSIIKGVSQQTILTLTYKYER